MKYRIMDMSILLIVVTILFLKLKHTHFFEWRMKLKYKKPWRIWLISLLETIYSQLCFQFRFHPWMWHTSYLTSRDYVVPKLKHTQLFEWTMKLKLPREFNIFVSLFFTLCDPQLILLRLILLVKGLQLIYEYYVLYLKPYFWHILK